MAIIQKFKSCVLSRPAKTLYWLLFAIVCCITIVIFLGSFAIPFKPFHLSENLEFSPKPDRDSVIYLKHKDPESCNKWEKKIAKFLKPFKKSHPQQVSCSFNRPPIDNQTCKVEVESFTPCVESMHFGYPTASPCIFIKFRKHFDFTPEYLDMASLENSTLDSSFTKHIKESLAGGNPQSLKTVWVSCEGRSAYDKELLGVVNYIPWSGFPDYAFHNQENEGYTEPLVAIQFLKPRIGTIIDVDCKVVARNFNETVSFKLLINGDGV